LQGEEIMLQKIKDFVEKHKISVGVAGTAIVLATAYGSCSYDLVEGDVGYEPPAKEEASE
jgi:proline racemase